MAIETFPTVPLSRALNGFGINLGSVLAQEWAYVEAKRAGCTEVRFQMAWSGVEDFDNPGRFNLSAMDEPLRLCKKYGMRPIVVAAYGPPHRTIQTVTVNGLHPIGSTTLTVTGNLSGIQLGRDHIGGLWYQVGFGKPAYYGGIIHDVSGQVITLGAATTGVFNNGDAISINRLLYPSVDSMKADSAERYADYVTALANKIAGEGVEGRIEVWNEPPWVNDTWDDRSRFYDDPVGKGIATWTFTIQPLITALATRTMPPGIGLVSSGTNKSGGHGILRYLTADQVAASSFVADAIHPYGPYPEYSWWWTSGAGLSWGAGFVNLNGNSNFAFNAKVQADNPSAGLEYVVTETGTHTTDNEVKRNYDLRHLVGAWSMGLTMVNFYSLADTVGLAQVDAVTHVPFDGWEDIVRLMDFLRVVNADVDRYVLPSINTWYGTEWNLAVHTIGPVMVVHQRPVPPGLDPVFPGPARLTLNAGPGSLFVLGVNNRTHQDAKGNVIYVGEKPVILTRYLG